MEIEEVNEGSNCSIILSFTDENGAQAVPSSIIYRIDTEFGGEITEDTNIIPVDSMYSIDISSEENRLVDASLDYEKHIVTVTWHYGDGKQGTEEYNYYVKNLSNIS